MTRSKRMPDLSGLIGAVRGTRTVVEIRSVQEYGDRQVVVLECVCGAVAKYEANAFKRGVGNCSKCRGSGSAGGKLLKINYDEWVGRDIDGLKVTAFFVDERPRFSLRCQRGHVIKRCAWEVVRTDKPKRCHECAKKPGARVAEYTAADASDVDIKLGANEPVCNCAWHNGVQRYVCNRHKGAA